MRGTGRARARAFWRARGPLIAALCLLASSVLGQAPQGSYSEDVVKAILLERIVTFLSWSQPASPETPVQLVVLGRGSLGGELERVYSRRKFAGRSIAVRYAERADAIGVAHIVIIGREHESDLADVLNACAHDGVLTVGDTPGFGERGVAINFYRDGSRVRFEVAPRALKRARIQPSYKLLTLARVVGGP